MLYKSTRGGVSSLTFEDAVVSGLADDGGLLVPQTVPMISADTLARWSKLSFQQLSFEVMSRFISNEEIPPADLESMIEKSFRSFDHPEITPVVRKGDVFILELFHGPTYSFKDIALQFLGNLLEYILAKRKLNVTVVGATSGDTGSAAIYGLKGKANVDVFILFPKGRISRVQELQMTSILDANIHNIAVLGTFDDAQSVVKGLFSDLEFKKKHRLVAINSINWSRILSQTVYYFYSYFRVHEQIKQAGEDTDVQLYFSVPTGNFGDILAGYYAKLMGLPISLIAATNENDIIHRFFDKGEYHRADKAIPTCSPSMDIQVASNFERYLFYLSGCDPKRVVEWMDLFNKNGKLSMGGDILAHAKTEMHSYMVSRAEVISTMQAMYEQHNYVVDPHTAIGISAAQHVVKGEKAKAVCLSTAHPAKFLETVEAAIGNHIDQSVIIAATPTLANLVKGVATRFVEAETTAAAVTSIIEASKNKP